jgi:hypothetical protein
MAEVDLVDWTLASVRELKAEEPKTPGNDAISAGKVPAFGPASLAPTPVELPLVAHDSKVGDIESHPVGDLAAGPSTELVEGSKLEVVDTQRLESLAPKPVKVEQPGIPFERDTHAALKKAVLDPDIYADKGDRSRAIDLRWILRDIRAKRTGWWPVGDRDLRVLTDMGLVEMREDVPVLTNLGRDAIA